jgi:hypothetical protein
VEWKYGAWLVMAVGAIIYCLELKSELGHKLTELGRIMFAMGLLAGLLGIALK